MTAFSGSARKSAGKVVTESVREMPLSIRAWGKPGSALPSMLIGNTWMPVARLKPWRIGAKASQRAHSPL